MVAQAILIAQGAATLYNMWQQGEQSRFNERMLRMQAEARKKFAHQMYGMTKEQAGLVKQQGNRKADLIERQGKFKMMYMEDAKKRRLGSYFAELGSSGTVANYGSGRNVIMTQARMDGLAMRFQAHETSRMSAETRYGANVKAHYMEKSARINRDNYMASANNMSTQADFMRQQRGYQAFGTLLSGSSSMIQTQSMLDKPIWA